MLCQPLQRFARVGCRLHVIAQPAEKARQRLPDAVFIVYDEHSRAVDGGFWRSHGRQRW